MGKNSLTHIVPGAVYQRPLPEFGKPGGAEGIKETYVTIPKALSKRSRAEYGRITWRVVEAWRRQAQREFPRT
jgi:hypothetical protein